MRAVLLAAGAVACFAQSPPELLEKAPPHIDEALRARIRKFYQAHVDGKFRIADEVVAENSKDAFFEAPKTRCYSYEIQKITYSDNFTSARAMVICEIDYPIPGFGVARSKMPMSGLWKLESGEWFYHIEQPTEIVTPFGKVKTSGASPPSAGTPPPQSPFPPGLGPGANFGAILTMVKADKSEVEFSMKQAGTAEVNIASNLPGSVKLVLGAPAVPGLEVKFDKEQLKAGEKARVILRYAPKEGQKPFNATVEIRVEPTGQIIAIRVVCR